MVFQQLIQSFRSKYKYFRLKEIDEAFEFGSQEDANEFFTKLAEAIERAYIACEKDDDGKTNNSPINDIFEGNYDGLIRCETCRTERMSLNAKFLQLNLPISEKKIKNVYDRLDSFSEWNIDRGDKFFECDRCQDTMNGKKKKQMAAFRENKLKQLPKSLCISLKRFVSVRHNDNEMEIKKLTKPIEYSELLNLKKHIALDINTKYRLGSFIVHEGETPNEGHYKA